MKKLIAFLCAVVIAAGALTACNAVPKIPVPENNPAATTAGDNGEVATSAPADSNTPTDNSSSEASSAVQIPAGDITGSGNAAKGIKVEGMPYSDEYSNKLFLFLTNESGAACDLSINVDFFDKNGNIVGTTSGYVDAFDNGTTVVTNYYCDDPFAKYEYSVAASETDYYLPVDKDLKVEVSKATNKAIVSITNNGKIAAKYPQYYAFFYKDGKLVYDNWGYCDDADSEIKPGATERDEASCYEEFDDVKVFVHSYAYKEN